MRTRFFIAISPYLFWTVLLAGVSACSSSRGTSSLDQSEQYFLSADLSKNYLFDRGLHSSFDSSFDIWIKKLRLEKFDDGKIGRASRTRNAIKRSFHEYNASLLTIVAGLESRNYERGEFESVVLDASGVPDQAVFYQNDVVGYYQGKEQLEKDDTLLIWLGSSYSTWKRGTWFNKVAGLSKELTKNNVSILAFPGPMTPKEFLRSAPKFPDPNGYFSARDLYHRISQFVSSKSKDGAENVVLMGASGGASLALWMSFHDNEGWIDRTVAFSPVLDTKRSFTILDFARSRAEASVGNAAITTPGSLIAGALKYPNHYSILSLFSKNADDEERARLINLFYNEFSVVDLKDTLEAAHPELLAEFSRDLRAETQDYADHTWTYLKQAPAIIQNTTGMSTQVLNKLNMPQTLIDGIQNPTWVVYPIDDPVLSVESPLSLGFASKFRLSRARSLLPEETSHTKIFAPEGGGHMGYFLDTQWLRNLVQHSLSF